MAPHDLHREAQVSQPVLDVMVCQVSFSSADPFLSTFVAKPVFCEYFILHFPPSPGCPSFYCFRLGQNLCFRSSSPPMVPEARASACTLLCAGFGAELLSDLLPGCMLRPWPELLHLQQVLTR